jgi:hypothetical protein
VLSKENRSRRPQQRERSLFLGSYLTVTATVAEWLSLPADPVDVPVIVRVPVSGGVELEQPAKAMRSTTAVPSATRARSPFAFASRKSNSNARIRGTICHIEIGGVGTGGGIVMPLPFLANATATD